MSRILLVGEDTNLLATRALLLSAWETEICRTSQAESALESNRFHAVVLGQLVDAQSARQIIATAKNVDARLLLVRYPGEEQDFDADIHTLNLDEGPAWLIRWAKETLRLDPHVDGKSTSGARGHDGTAGASHGSQELGASCL